MTAAELQQIAIDTFSEIKIFLRGQEYKKKEVIKGLRDLLEFFEREDKERPTERLCAICGRTPVIQDRWKAGHRICSECSKEEARAKGQ